MEKVSKSAKTWIVACEQTNDSAIFKKILGFSFRTFVSNEFGVILTEKLPHIVRIHSLFLYTKWIEYKNVGETNTSLLFCFPFISMPKVGDIITTGQHLKYQSVSKLQLRLVLKRSFHSIHKNLRVTSGEKIHQVSVGITRFLLIFRRTFNKIFFKKYAESWLFEVKQSFCSMKVSVDGVERELLCLQKLLEQPKLPFCVKNSSQLQNVLVPICWTFLHQNLEKLLVVERTFQQLQRVSEDKMRENIWVKLAWRQMHAESYQESLQNKAVGRE